MEKTLEQRGILTRAYMDSLREKHTQYLLEASKRVRTEPQPEGSSIYTHVFALPDREPGRNGSTSGGGPAPANGGR